MIVFAESQISTKGNVIVNSLDLLRQLREVKCNYDGFVGLSVENGRLRIETAKAVLYGISKKDFTVPLYYKTIERLKRLLMLIDEQPFNIELTDSETFNVKICEAYV
jgi:hypothetical protein